MRQYQTKDRDNDGWLVGWLVGWLNDWSTLFSLLSDKVTWVIPYNCYIFT